MAAPKRRGLSYQVLCSGLSNNGAAATYVIARKMGKPRSTVKRALEDLQRKGLVIKHVADRRGAARDATKLDVMTGTSQKIFLWEANMRGKSGDKIRARCELYPAFLRRHGFAGASKRSK